MKKETWKTILQVLASITTQRGQAPLCRRRLKKAGFEMPKLAIPEAGLLFMK